MARRHAVKAEEVRVVFAGVVGSGLGERVGKRADVEAWRSLEPSEEEAHKHRKQRPRVPTRHSKGNQGRLSVSRISTSLPDNTALAKQWARPRCLGL